MEKLEKKQPLKVEVPELALQLNYSHLFKEIS